MISASLNKIRPFFLSQLALLFIICLILLPKNRAVLYGYFDGSFFKTQIQQQRRWSPPFAPYFTCNHFQGLGNIDFPVNFQWMPASNISVSADGEHLSTTTSYVVISLELFAAIYFLARRLRARRVVASTSAWLTVLSVLPFISPWPLYQISRLAPHFFEPLAAVCLICGYVILAGSGDTRRDLRYWLILFTLVTWLIIADPLLVFVYTPTVLIFTVSLLCLIPKSERRRKLVIMGTLIASMVPTALPFVAGLSLYSVPSLCGSSLFNDRMGLNAVSAVFNGWLGPWLYASAMISSVCLLRTKVANYRALGISTLIIGIGIVFGGTFLMTRVADYHGTMPIYCEIYAWPLYFISSAIAIERGLLGCAAKMNIKKRFFRSQSRNTHSLVSRTTFCIPALMVAAAFFLPGEKNSGWVYPPKLVAIAAYLKHEIGQVPGCLYRGSVATFTGEVAGGGTTWYDQIRYDAILAAETGNELRTVGFWYYGVPTLFEYNQLITPNAFWILTRALADRSDKQIRNVLVLTRINANLLQSLGVRFVVVPRNSTVPGAREIANMGDKVSLFEFPGPNLGNYSPTEAQFVNNSETAIECMLSPNFNFRKKCLVQVPINEHLVPATGTTLNLQSTGLHIKSHSDGTSILLLPIQYSHCLELEHGGEDQARVIRVNLLQTGIVFSKSLDAHLTFRSGLFDHQFGRLYDYWDAKTLGIGRSSTIK